MQLKSKKSNIYTIGALFFFNWQVPTNEKCHWNAEYQQTTNTPNCEARLDTAVFTKSLHHRLNIF